MLLYKSWQGAYFDDLFYRPGSGCHESKKKKWNVGHEPRQRDSGSICRIASGQKNSYVLTLKLLADIWK